jgi:hypothetical protein
MIKKALTFFLLSTLLISCNKMTINPPMLIEGEQELDQNQKIILSGDFKAAAHPTSGKAEIIEEDGIKKLKFSNFKTDSGPDLRVYLAEDNKASNFIEISNKVENGTLIYSLPTGINLEKQKYVLIWCKLFKVNFGTAVLNTPTA